MSLSRRESACLRRSGSVAAFEAPLGRGHALCADLMHKPQNSWRLLLSTLYAGFPSHTHLRSKLGGRL